MSESGGFGIVGPKRKRDTLSAAPNKRSIMSAMHAMPSLNLPPALDTNQNGAYYPRKSNKSNNRREWMKECLRLLEAMMVEEDSVPFREPVDCLKYPDFYTMVGDPIDLSKVMLKFRGGQYQDPFDFEKDVKQLFNDYKSFFTDSKTDIYVKTQNMSLWFELEFRRILDKYGEKLKRRSEVIAGPVMSTNTRQPSNANIVVSINNGSCTILQSPEGTVETAKLEQKLSSSHKWNEMGKTYDFVPKKTDTEVISYLDNDPVSLKVVEGSDGSLESGNSQWQSHDQPVPIINHNSSNQFKLANRKSSFSSEIGAKLSLFNENVEENAMRGCEINTSRYIHHQFHHPLLHAHTPPERYTCSSLSERSFSQHSDPGAFLRKDRSMDLHSPTLARYTRDSPRQQQREFTPQVFTASNTFEPVNDVVTEKKNSAIHTNIHVGTSLIGMTLDVTNVFFGRVRCKPVQPVIVHENGFKIQVVLKEKDKPTMVKINVEEIVRCAAHLGRNKKHTLFVFVTPSFVSHLEASLSEQNSKASLIVFFMPAMSVTQIGRFLHVFHNMSKHSIFGNLFSEINQKAALSLLTNIKPQISDKITETGRKKESEVLSCFLSSAQRNPIIRSSSLPTSCSTTHKQISIKSGVPLIPEQGHALDLTVPFVQTAASELTIPFSAVNVSDTKKSSQSCSILEKTSSQNPVINSKNSSVTASPSCSLHKVVSSVASKTYKPKFHFRSHSSHGPLIKQGSTNSEPGYLFQGYSGSRSLDIEIGADGPVNGSSGEISSDNNIQLDFSKTRDVEQDMEEGHDSIKVESTDFNRHDEQSQKEDDSDIELYIEPDEEDVSSSHNSVLLFNDSFGEDLIIVDDEDDDIMFSIVQMHSGRRHYPPPNDVRYYF